MRSLLVSSLIVLALCLPAPAAAQSVGFGVHANGASLNIAGPLGDVYGGGFGGGAHLDISLPMLSFRISGDYIGFAPDNDKYKEKLGQLLGTGASGFAVDGGRISIISGNANLKWGILPIPVVTPYLTGGIGLARIGVDDANVKLNGNPIGNVAGVKAETKTAFNLGAGVDLKIGITLFLEAKYTWIMTEGEASTYIPVSLGITF
jgi:opacity protein-like surface antigen